MSFDIFPFRTVIYDYFFNVVIPFLNEMIPFGNSYFDMCK